MKSMIAGRSTCNDPDPLRATDPENDNEPTPDPKVGMGSDAATLEGQALPY